MTHRAAPFLRTTVFPAITLLALSGALGCRGRDPEPPDTAIMRSVGESACPGCSISTKPVVSLHSTDSATITWGSMLVRGVRGGYFAAPIAEEGRIARWSATGEPQPAIGRLGEGPGEFVAIRAIALTAGDSLLVLDRSRVTLLSPTGEYVRSADIPAGVMAFRLIALPGGGVLLNNTGPSRPAFVELDSRLQLRRAFGVKLLHPPAIGAVRDSLINMMAVTPTGELWTVPQRYRYAFDHWDADRRREARFVREVDWFEPWTQADYEAELAHQVWEVRPLPLPLALGTDSAGRLWTSIRVARRGWSPSTAGAPSPEAGSEHRPLRRPATSDPDPAGFIETAVDVLDPAHGSIVATGRVAARLRGFVGPEPSAYTTLEDSQGLLRFEVVRLSLSTSPAARGTHD